jgi:hypothetical protein
MTLAEELRKIGNPEDEEFSDAKRRLREAATNKKELLLMDDPGLKEYLVSEGLSVIPHKNAFLKVSWSEN